MVSDLHGVIAATDDVTRATDDVMVYRGDHLHVMSTLTTPNRYELWTPYSLCSPLKGCEGNCRPGGK